MAELTEMRRGCRVASLLALFALAGVTILGCVTRPVPPKMPVRGLCAHRGDAAAFPENTVPAIEAAAKKGAAMVEIDVKRCKTGELVLMHDSSVDRTTTGKGKISELTFDEIRSFDAGVKKDPKFAGIKVPTFDEAMDCLPKEGIWVNIHCKEADVAREVTAKLKAKGRVGQSFITGRENIAKAAREVVPDIKVCVFYRPGGGYVKKFTDEVLQAYVDYAKRNNFQFIQHGKALRDAPAYRDFRAHGGMVNYCFANTEEDAKKIYALGLDFALTDNLDAMLPFFPTRFAHEK